MVADAYQDGSDTVVELDVSNSIRLSGMDVLQLHEDDFRLI